MDKSDNKCKYICSKGNKCKRVATDGTLCWQHVDIKKRKEETKRETIENNMTDLRGISLKDNYTNLGWKEGMNMDDYSKEFLIVMNSLKDLGSLIQGNWKISLHRHYPGIQFTNKEPYDSKDKYFYFPGKESRSFRNKYKYFPNPDFALDEEQTLDYLSNKSKVWDQNISYFDKDTFRSVEVKAKDDKGVIQKQVLKLLSGMYKIHLQPKPEYQIFIIKQFIDLLNKDQYFRSLIEDFKCVIPYHRTLDDNRIPAIVIYPVYGKKESTNVLQTLISNLKYLDDKKLGLGITPRFNHKFNNLIYWAEYHGGYKKYFLEKYPDEMGNVFDPPEYAHFKCKNNKCHIEP